MTTFWGSGPERRYNPTNGQEAALRAVLTSGQQRERVPTRWGGPPSVWTPAESGGQRHQLDRTECRRQKSQESSQVFGVTMRDTQGDLRTVLKNASGKMRNERKRTWIKPTRPTDKDQRLQELAKTSGANTVPFDHNQALGDQHWIMGPHFLAPTCRCPQWEGRKGFSTFPLSQIRVEEVQMSRWIWEVQEHTWPWSVPWQIHPRPAVSGGSWTNCSRWHCKTGVLHGSTWNRMATGETRPAAHCSLKLRHQRKQWLGPPPFCITLVLEKMSKGWLRIKPVTLSDPFWL